MSTASHAQEAVATPSQIEASGEAYLRAIPTRRINTDVVYFDPTAPPPKLETREEPEPDQDTADGEIDVNVAVIAGLILVGIIFLFARYGGTMSVSFRSDAENVERIRRTGARNHMFGEMEPTTLDKILCLKDRRTALILLAQSALTCAVTADGVLLQRSWTARDALRRVPVEFGLKSALTDLVFASERVQFGDRDVTEEEFQFHVDIIRPLFSGPTS